MSTNEKHEHLLYHVIALREKQIKDLESRVGELQLLLREAIELIEETGLDASPQRAAIAKAAAREAQP